MKYKNLDDVYGFNIPETFKDHIGISIRDLNNAEKINEYNIDMDYEMEDDTDIVKIEFYKLSNGDIFYKVIEPSLNGDGRKFLKNIQNIIRKDITRKDISKYKDQPYEDENKEKIEILKNMTEKSIKRHYITDEFYNTLLDKFETVYQSYEPDYSVENKKKELPSDKFKNKIKYYIIRNIVYEGKLSVLRNDDKIEDINSKVNKPITITHRSYKTDCITNIALTPTEFTNYSNRVEGVVGDRLSDERPSIDGRLEDGSRISLSKHGSKINRGEGDTPLKPGELTIRQFNKIPYTPADLIRNGTINARQMAYIWFKVQEKKNIILVGETSSGKTTTLNSLIMLFSPGQNILTIEDTSEIKTYNNNNIKSKITNPESSITDLLESGLRKNPEYIIVGEARSPETIKQTIKTGQTGHGFYTTIHADNMESFKSRLDNADLTEADMKMIDDVIFMKKLGGTKNRRVINNIEEIHIDDTDIQNKTIGKYNRSENNFEDIIEKSEYIRENEEDLRKAYSKTIDRNINERAIILEYIHNMFKNISLDEELNEEFMKTKYKFEYDIYKTYMNEDSRSRDSKVLKAIKNKNITDISSVNIEKAYAELKGLNIEDVDIERTTQIPDLLNELNLVNENPALNREGDKND